MNDWQSLVETEGVALTTPVLKRAFPNGIVTAPSDVRADVRQKLAALREEEIHRWEWTRFLLRDVLGWKERLVEGTDGLIFPIPEKRTELAPDMVLVDPTANGEGRHRLLVVEVPHGTPFDTPLRTDGNWAATPAERAERLCRDARVELALLTDGELLRVIWAAPDGQVGQATWPTEFLGDERDLLSAFVELLGAQRFFALAPENRLDALYRESVTAQQEVTKTLGRQVRQAVELLINAISRADRAESNRLLAGVEPRGVYEAAVTVLMRIVFLLYAEERRLLPLEDPVYNANYAILPMRERLEERARLSDEALSFGHAAWAQVLATSRAVYGGIQHERLRLPPYGGSLFDPDRYPFLEGRPAKSKWQEAESAPIPVDDRTMLAVLGALQQLKVKGELRSLSFRQLAVEQIGHVYEGLLDHGCVRAAEVVVGLDGKEGFEPELALARLEETLAQGLDALVDLVVEASKLTRNKVQKLVLASPTPEELGALSAACGHDDELTARVRDFLPLLRRDLNGLPMVFPPGSMYVTQTGQRRDSGTAYTTPELADEVVLYALEPQVYAPGPAQTADRSEWRLKNSAEILDLKVCDPAVGSGAILVAAVRYLAERLVEAWRAEIEDGTPVRLLDGVPEDDWELIARRAVVDHCIHGVDRNPMAVEMAKLSLWLTTMAHDRPFTFLDHQLRSGDSLLGITDLDQLRFFHPDPTSSEARQHRLFDPKEVIEPRVERALGLARELAAIDVRTLRDADAKRLLQGKLEDELRPLTAVADALVGAMLASAGDAYTALEGRLVALGERVIALLGTVDDDALAALRAGAQPLLDTGAPHAHPGRQPLHWPLVFPEVFLSDGAGFTAMIGNPPFLGGQRIKGAAGTAYRNYLVRWVANGRTGSADLVAYFFLRSSGLVRTDGTLGFLATNTIAQGDTSEVGLTQLIDSDWVLYRAFSSTAWPGEASLEIAKVWLSRGEWKGECFLDDRLVPGIDEMLYPMSRSGWRKQRLAENAGQSFIGSYVLGMGFTMPPEEAKALIAKDRRNADVLFPYLGGEDLNQSPTQTAPRWIINFFDWDEERAKTYPDCYGILEREVKPSRASVTDAAARYWWRYLRPRPELYRRITPLERVLAIARVSKTVMPVFVHPRQVLNEKIVVFALDTDFGLGILTSGFHTRWAIRHGTTLRTDPQYTPSDVFDTFPQPPFSKTIEDAAHALDAFRSRLMVERAMGLTDVYNRVHDPDEREDQINTLRTLHVALDIAVRDAYGWADLDLNHDFHPVRGQGARFTFPSEVADEVLDRLLELNKERFEAEPQHVVDGKTGKHPEETEEGDPDNGDPVAALF